MTAPERFADSQIPLAPRAPSIHERLVAGGRGSTSGQMQKSNVPNFHRRPFKAIAIRVPHKG
jgi:hypothetical protein